MDTKSRLDQVEKIYDARIRGVFMISTVAGGRVHIHGGCWVAPCSHTPPRMMVSIPKEFEGAALVKEGGVFALSLLATDQMAFNDSFFEGRQHIDEIGRERFLRAPSGCPVLADGVAYFDCRVFRTVDLGDALLVFGDVTEAALLHPEKENLSVNAIVARSDPRGRHETRLPFQGYSYDTRQLQAAPRGEVTPPDGAWLERVHAHRHWGLFYVSTTAGGRGHHHIGCWSIQVSHEPPRLVVCFSKKWEGSRLVQQEGCLALTLLAQEQLPLVLAFAQGNQSPATLGETHFRAARSGCDVLKGGVGFFDCKVEDVLDVGDFLAVLAEVTDFGWLERQRVNLTDEEIVVALDGRPWTDPRVGFDRV